MKKVLTIGLMLLACAGFVFAADEDKTDTLKVQIKIDPYTQAEWFETVPEDKDWSTNGDIVDELTSDQIKDGVTYFAAVRTNNSTLGTITIDAAPLKIKITDDPMYTDNANEYIKYSVRPHTDSDNDNKDVTGSDSLSTITDTQKTVAVYKAASSVTGARFMYAKIDVQVDSTSYANASAGTYEASLIMTLSAQ